VETRVIKVILITLEAKNEELTNQLKQLSNLESVDDHIVKIEKLIKDKTEEYNLLKEQLNKNDIYMTRLETLKNSFKDVKTSIFQSTLEVLQFKINSFCEKFFDIDVKIQFENKSGKIQTFIFVDGNQRSIGLLSGGQFKRLSLATSLALSDLVLERTDCKIGLRIFDEPFQNLSETSMRRCIDIFKTLDLTIILIEHNTIAKAEVNKTYSIEYRDGTSSYIR